MTEPTRVDSVEQTDPALDEEALLVCMLDPPPPPVPIDIADLVDPLAVICLSKSDVGWSGCQLDNETRALVASKLIAAGANPGEWWQLRATPGRRRMPS